MCREREENANDSVYVLHVTGMTEQTNVFMRHRSRLHTTFLPSTLIAIIKNSDAPPGKRRGGTEPATGPDFSDVGKAGPDAPSSSGGQPSDLDV